VTGPTGWTALDLAIARIPTYRPGAAIWLVSDKYGHWGTADWYHATLYISPAVPTARVYDVAVHEWSHELSVLDYDGDVDAATAAMNATFGGSGLVGAERAADCMAKLQGASYTHYTSCTDTDWRRAAARLLAGSRL
jgi:roadblock/LC7 domain-containing protein